MPDHIGTDNENNGNDDNENDDDDDDGDGDRGMMVIMIDHWYSPILPPS